ncbi:hypothetical protein MRB53_013644 [Persea americana]|uniref:Uncharacterized protein n=1 Tax=Persea americana TaxID=3435 RepID=A0ACC2K964_PERAE|nr:hypothetical protein MRB53_013644 [Persea americana]
METLLPSFGNSSAEAGGGETAAGRWRKAPAARCNSGDADWRLQQSRSSEIRSGKSGSVPPLCATTLFLCGAGRIKET